MSVDGVNNNSNAGLYALGGALVGAGAGAATAYLTKPYLSDGAPTDTFTLKVYEKVKEDFPERTKDIEQSLKSIDEAKTIEELKKFYIGPIEKLKPSELSSSEVLDFYKSIGVKQEYIDKLKNVKTTEEANTILSNMFDKEYASKGFEEAKNAIKEEAVNAKKEIGKFLFEKFWDKDKKEFKNCEEGIGKTLKDAARSIQGKQALIYGGIGAVVLGILTYFAAAGNKSSKAPAKNK